MKYEGKSPILQACAIPFRRNGGQYEFCLITSLRKGRWGFPKGIIDKGETHIEAATGIQEARELQCLTLRPALMKAINQLKNNWFQPKVLRTEQCVGRVILPSR